MTPTPNNETLAARMAVKPVVQRLMDLARHFRAAPGSDYDVAYKELESFAYGALASSGQAASAVPVGMRLVPLEFVQGFCVLAHNYSLRAVPPDYYRGVEGDAFSAAYRRCGEDLAKLRAMLAASPTQPASAPAREGLRCADCDIENGCPEYCRCTPPAPRAPSIDPALYCQKCGGEFLTGGCDCAPSLAAPAGAGVEEFPLPEFPPEDTKQCLPYSAIRYVAGYPHSYVQKCAEEYARATLRSYSASLGLQARTEGKV